jgi:hypothetical protein
MLLDVKCVLLFSLQFRLKHLSFSEELGDIIIIIGIQPLGQFGQRPELGRATGIALVRCILGKFLGVVCHCFPPR